MASVSARDLAVVFLGGAAGVGVRFALEAAFPAASGGWPVTTFAINIVGSLLLGAVFAFFASRGPETPRLRAARLGIGTGVIGGFTTYSTFSVETVRLLEAGAPALGLAYAVVSVVLGIAAAALGMRVMTRWAGQVDA